MLWTRHLAHVTSATADSGVVLLLLVSHFDIRKGSLTTRDGQDKVLREVSFLALISFQTVEIPIGLAQSTFNGREIRGCIQGQGATRPVLSKVVDIRSTR